MKPDLNILSDLPTQLAIFPLSNVLLLPRGQLPLNIFERRYFEMINDSFKNNRMIGMVQPQMHKSAGESEVCMTGCAGRIIHLEETGPSKYLVTLVGVCRFEIIKEVTCDTPYRQITPDWQKYKSDLDVVDYTSFDKTEFLNVLKTYLTKMDMICDKWDEMKHIPAEKLLATLAMICPFTSAEKQALLEAENFEHRVSVLKTLMQMANQGHAMGRH